MFFAKHWKFHLNWKYFSIIPRKIYGFLDNLIWFGNGKFSLLLREYSELAVNMLTSSRKMWDLIKKNFPDSIWPRMMEKKDESAFQEISVVFGLVKTFTAKAFSERSFVMLQISRYFAANNFRNTWLMRLILFPEHWKYHLYLKHASAIRQRIYGFLDSLIWIGNRKFFLILR